MPPCDIAGKQNGGGLNGRIEETIALWAPRRLNNVLFSGWVHNLSGPKVFQDAQFFVKASYAMQEDNIL